MWPYLISFVTASSPGIGRQSLTFPRACTCQQGYGRALIPTPWNESTPTQPGTGSGSGSSHRLADGGTETLESKDGIASTSPLFSVQSPRQNSLSEGLGAFLARDFKGARARSARAASNVPFIACPKTLVFGPTHSSPDECVESINYRRLCREGDLTEILYQFQ